MKRIKLLSVILAAALALALDGGAAWANGPKLDGVWFKLRGQAKGHSVNWDDGSFRTLNFSFPAYLHFSWDQAHNSYHFDLWSQWGTPPQWVNMYSDYVSTIPQNENFMPQFFMQIWLGGTDYLCLRHTPFINIKTDAQGAFRKAAYSGTGEVFIGMVEGSTRLFYGYCKISGTSITSDKLPFTP